MAQQELRDSGSSGRSNVIGWLILSWVSTVAGNVTLIGSAANVIVAERAMRYARADKETDSHSHMSGRVHISAVHHFKICGAVSLVVIVLGIAILVLETTVMGYK